MKKYDNIRSVGAFWKIDRNLSSQQFFKSLFIVAPRRTRRKILTVFSHFRRTFAHNLTQKISSFVS